MTDDAAASARLPSLSEVPGPAQRDVSPIWEALRAATPARIGLMRAGDRLATKEQVALRAAHAAARDAVHAELDLAALTGELKALRLGEPVVVASRASTRADYLRRPHLGRSLASDAMLPSGAFDLVFVVSDGLSGTAVREHAAGVMAAFVLAAPPGLCVGPPVVVRNGRVAIGDEIGARMGARAVAVVLGERPGLSVRDSLGVYLTWAPRVGRLDAERNCISNIHTSGGMTYVQAASEITRLFTLAQALGSSGVAAATGGVRAVE